MCAVGGWCNPRDGTGIREIQAKNGWGKVSTGDDRGLSRQDMFRECPNPGACFGRGNPDLGAEFAISSMCHPHYAGALCLACYEEGYSPSSDDTFGVCPEKETLRLYLVLGILVALGGITFLIRSTWFAVCSPSPRPLPRQAPRS
jgi:hypothetical protein